MTETCALAEINWASHMYRRHLSLQMSAGSQIQMAPQTTVNTGQPLHSNQDSNMSTGKVFVAQVQFNLVM